MTESEQNTSFFFANVKIVLSARVSRTCAPDPAAPAQVVGLQRLTTGEVARLLHPIRKLTARENRDNKKTPSIFGGGRFIVTFLVFLNPRKERQGLRHLSRQAHRQVQPQPLRLARLLR